MTHLPHQPSADTCRIAARCPDCGAIAETSTIAIPGIGQLVRSLDPETIALHSACDLLQLSRALSSAARSLSPLL